MTVAPYSISEKVNRDFFFLVTLCFLGFWFCHHHHPSVLTTMPTAPPWAPLPWAWALYVGGTCCPSVVLCTHALEPASWILAASASAQPLLAQTLWQATASVSPRDLRLNRTDCTGFSSFKPLPSPLLPVRSWQFLTCTPAGLWPWMTLQSQPGPLLRPAQLPTKETDEIGTVFRNYFGYTQQITNTGKETNIIMSAFVNCNFWNLWLLLKGILGGNTQTLNIDVLEQHVLVSIGIFNEKCFS